MVAVAAVVLKVSASTPGEAAPVVSWVPEEAAVVV